MEKKICAISDIHGHLPEIPECDILCICGDIIPLYIQRDFAQSIAWLSGPFQKWALEAPCKHVVMVWGNHDFIGERLDKYGCKEPNEEYQWLLGMNPKQVCEFLFKCDEDNKIHLLLDTEEVIDGIKFYGMPWCPSLRNWAFYGDSETLKEKFNQIPSDFDVLLTHCPPKYGQQGIVLQTNWNFGKDFGCEELQEALVQKTMLRSDVCWVLSGHIHSGNHNWETHGPLVYRNVSIMDEDYEPTYSPLLFNINK
jgi:predicted MPP superfamily phosphohydrolase